jgi:hypothetical protein
MKTMIGIITILLSSSIVSASDYKLVPSIGVGGITELGNSFNPFYKFRLDAETPKLIGPLSLDAGVAITAYQIPYYLDAGGTSTKNRTKQLVDEWKIDYQVAGVYSMEYDEVTYQLFVGGSGVYIDNKKVSFNAAGPMAGFRTYTDNDWGRALIGMDITPYLLSQEKYAATQSKTTSTSTDTSIFGKPVLSTNYKILFSIPYDAGYRLDYFLDGQMIMFDKSYRYYNGIAVALRF